MKYEQFEDLPVWNAAADLAATMFTWTEHPEFRGKGDLANQLQRAPLSISNNIAEGFERGTTKELLTFLYYARGSAGEVRSMLGVMDRMEQFNLMKSEISNLKSECKSISRQLRGWAGSLQDSEITGQRYLNEQTKKQYQQNQSREQFIQSQGEFRRELEKRLTSEARQRVEADLEAGNREAGNREAGNRKLSNRNAFSIIEVLTSIVVAMIGVFGVMILIPFAVRQAQTGLDADAATVVARNAFAQFEVGGFRNPERWQIQGGRASASPFEAFSIDPLGVTENGSNYTTTKFPFKNLTLPNELFLRPANLLLPPTPTNPTNPFTIADARKMFRSSDELAFGDPVATPSSEAALNPPTPIYDVAANGTTPIRRQSTGAFSWSAIVVPQGASSQSNKFRMFILVYKDRLTSLAINDDEFKMLSAAVATPNGGFQSPVTNLTLAGGLTNHPVRRGDWVMLVNKVAGRPHQLGFYRVAYYDIDTPLEIALDGPDYDFSGGATHLVHLKHVVGVYEKTFTVEQQSNWTLSN